MKVVTDGVVLKEKELSRGEYALVNDTFVGAYLLLINQKGDCIRVRRPSKTVEESASRKALFPKSKEIRKVRYTEEGQMITCASQVYHLDETYVKVASGDIRQVYIEKLNDGTAVFHEKRLPYEHGKEQVTKLDICDMLEDPTLNIYDDEGKIITDFPSEDEILEASVEKVLALYDSGYVGYNPKRIEKLRGFSRENHNGLTLDDFTREVTLFPYTIVRKGDNGVESVSKVHAKYVGKGKYEIESFKYQIGKNNIKKATR